MEKIEVMDKYLSTFGGKISTSEICKVVYKVFGIDLDKISFNKIDSFITQSRVIMDRYLDYNGNKMTATEVCKMLHKIFGINLNAIASLEQERISLFSKGQWVVQNKKDLFIVYTGNDDVDVKVIPTKYFTEQTGLVELPIELKHLLLDIGFYYNEDIKSYYYANPTGKAVPDQFKGQTIRAILKVIHKQYSHL